jgi:hypothetical protein
LGLFVYFYTQQGASLAFAVIQIIKYLEQLEIISEERVESGTES